MAASLGSGIYELVNQNNGKIYIGSSIDLARRFAKHRSQLDRGVHHSRILQNAWNKYGGHAFTFRPLLICAPNMLLFFEQRCIDAYKPAYNVSPTAASLLGVKYSEARRMRHAAGMRNRKPPAPFSEEHRAAISRALAGIPHGPMSDKTKALLSERHAGKSRGPRPEYIGKKISESHRMSGVKPSAECRAAAAKANRGRKLSPAHVAKLIAARLGKKRGPYKKKPKVSL